METSESTEAIRRKIISDAEKKSQELIERAKNQAEEVLNTAKKRAEEMKREELDRIEKHIKERSVQDLAEKKVAHHRRLQAFKSQIIDDTFEKAKEELRKHVLKPKYFETLKGLIIEPGVSLGGGKLTVRLNETDSKKMSKGVLRKLSAAIKKRTGSVTEVVLDENSIKAMGGVVVAAPDQNASIDNTLEARIERLKEEAKAELEAILFE
jgi:vacuolar-type H+-ATPase subunit E/Vma4